MALAAEDVMREVEAAAAGRAFARSGGRNVQLGDDMAGTITSGTMREVDLSVRPG